MKKQWLLASLAAMMATSVWAAEPTTVLETTSAVEQTVYGRVQEGAIVDRINQLDSTVYGDKTHTTGTLNTRANTLYKEVDGTGQTISLREQMDALEFGYESQIGQGSLVERLERMERAVDGEIHTGSLQSRIRTLQNKINGPRVTLTHQVATIPNTEVFKIKLDDAVSTKVNAVGDAVHFTVVDSIMDGNVLLVPAGTQGVAHIKTLKKARSFGRNAALDMTFDEIPAIDGTTFTAVQGEEAQEKTKTELTAAGASVAGAVLLGPVGLVGGFFVKGKNIELPVGTEMYVQPEDAVTVQGLVIGGDGLAHTTESVNAIADRIVSEEHPEMTVEENTSDAIETVDSAKEEAKETVADAESTTSDDAVNEPIVVVKRN